ncbi:MAG: DUF2177 family protein [Alphaproteobacteria bacterium]|nr:DUF2177 family protein [Alphaproteobacteria bacterium]
MLVFATAYAATAVCFFAFDFVWLTMATDRLYKPLLGPLLAAEPSLPVAGLFYVFYVVGLVVFAVLPAVSSGSWLMAIGLGALLGLVAYGTYDITNLATLRDWPLTVTLIDLAWGTFVSAAAALAGYAALRGTGLA